MSIRPFRSMFPELRKAMQVFDEPFFQQRNLASVFDANELYNPLSDVIETESSYTIEMELPGLEKKDVQIECNENNSIVVKGHTEKTTTDKKSTYWTQERFSGSFQRNFSLPSNIDKEGITAAFKDGLLKLGVPKKEGSARTIQIQE